MIHMILLYAGAALPLAWGLAHLFPTGAVVRGFGDIGGDNRHIITMEWLLEGVALMFIGILVATVTFIAPADVIAKAVYLLSINCLLAFALVSLFTGFNVAFLPFRLCPFIFVSAAVLIFLGGVV